MLYFTQKPYLEDEDDDDELDHVVRRRTNRKTTHNGAANQEASLNGAVSSAADELSEQKNGVVRSKGSRTRQRRRLEQAVG